MGEIRSRASSVGAGAEDEAFSRKTGASSSSRPRLGQDRLLLWRWSGTGLPAGHAAFTRLGPWRAEGPASHSGNTHALLAVEPVVGLATLPSGR